MLLPTFQAAGTRQVSNTADITVAWPTHVPGDIALLIVENRNEPHTLTTPAGFTLISSQGTGTAGAGASVGLGVYWCRATSSAMASPVVHWVAGHHMAKILTFRNCVQTGDPFEALNGNVLASGNTAVTIPGGTTDFANCLALAFAAERTDSDTNQFSNAANADLSSVSIIDQENSSVGNGGGWGVIAGNKLTEGTIGNTTATIATGSIQARIFFALLPRIAPTFFGAGPFAKWNKLHEGEEANVCAWPAGHQAGDFALLVIESENRSNVNFTDAAGFVAVAGASQGVGSSYVSSEKVQVLSCTATSGAMPNVVFDLTDDVSQGANQIHFAAQILVFRGCAPDAVHVVAGDTLDVDQTAFTVPGVTTTYDKCLIVAIAGSTYDIDINNSSGWTNANLLNLAQITNVYTSFGKGGGFAVAIGTLLAAGATGSTTGSWQFSNGPDQQAQARVCIALIGELNHLSGTGAIALPVAAGTITNSPLIPNPAQRRGGTLRRRRR